MGGERRSLPPWRSVVMITTLPWAAFLAFALLYALFSAGAVLGFLASALILTLLILLLRSAGRRAAERAYHPHLGPGGPLVHEESDEA